MPRLSIIIPTLGDWEALETTLVAVLQNRPEASEVVVVHNRPYGDPYALRGEVQFLELFQRSRLVDLINAGFAAARGEIIHVLPCGAEVDEGWAEAALRQFRDPQIALVAPVVVDRTATRVVTAGCTWSRGGKWSAFGSGASLGTPLATDGKWVGPEAFAGFYRRETLARLGTLDATLPAELAAIDLGLRVRGAGQRSRLEPNSQVRVNERSLARTRAFGQGWHSERLFWREPRGGSVAARLVAHAFTVLVETACVVGRPSNAVRVAGRVLSVCDTRKARIMPLVQEHSRTCTTAGSDLRGSDLHGSDLRLDAAHPVGCSGHAGVGRRTPVNLSANEAMS